MNVEQFEQFEQELIKHGYRKWNGKISNEDYYWCKGFEHYEDEDGDERCSYQVLFQIWDNRKYSQVPDNSKFGVQVTVLISDNHRTDLILCRPIYNIEEVEKQASSFYNWIKDNLEL